jgi:hypothetical protein
MEMMISARPSLLRIHMLRKRMSTDVPQALHLHLSLRRREPAQLFKTFHSKLDGRNQILEVLQQAQVEAEAVSLA